MKVHDMRLSFIWCTTNLHLLTHAPTVFALVARRPDYTHTFERIRGGVPDEHGLLPPWPQRGRQLFWTAYLEGRDPHTVTGSLAWKSLAPLRYRLRARIGADWLPGAASAQAFVYPFGHALVIDFTCRPDPALSLDAAIELAFTIRRTGKLDVTGLGANPVHETLDGLAQLARQAISTTLYGQPGMPEERLGEMYSVATFVRLEDVDVVAAIPENGDVHRALEALTAWRPTYKADALPPLAETRLETRTAPASHVLYGQRRGRAVWFPYTADIANGAINSLACYHRNQVFAAMQVESLAALVTTSAHMIENGDAVSPEQESLTRAAAGILGRMYGGDRSTYRTHGAKHHLARNDVIDALDDMRDRYNMMKITR